MPIKRLDIYIELEKKLSVLRTHFDFCRGAKPSEVLDWARFFHQWSKDVAPHGGPWSKQNLLKADKLANQLKSPGAGFDAFGALENLMAEASEKMRDEIMEQSSSFVEAIRG